MTRVVEIDPGTSSIDVCGIVDGLYLDRSRPTAEALSDPARLVELLTTPEALARSEPSRNGWVLRGYPWFQRRSERRPGGPVESTGGARDGP